MTAQPALLRRRDAAQATLNRFKDRPLKYGTRDCVRMTATHLRLLGYRIRLPAAGSYRSAKSGLRKLRERGHETLAEALDGLGLPRITPAAAIVGDVLQIEGDDPIGALFIALGNGRVVGYHEAIAGAAVLQPIKPALAAWRVVPRG